MAPCNCSTEGGWNYSAYFRMNIGMSLSNEWSGWCQSCREQKCSTNSLLLPLTLYRSCAAGQALHLNHYMHVFSSLSQIFAPTDWFAPTDICPQKYLLPLCIHRSCAARQASFARRGGSSWASWVSGIIWQRNLIIIIIIMRRKVMIRSCSLAKQPNIDAVGTEDKLPLILLISPSGQRFTQLYLDLATLKFLR